MFQKLLPRKYAEYLSLGAEIAVSLAGPILIGHWVDSYFEVYPYGLFSGIVLGLVTFLFNMVRIAKKTASEDKHDQK